jgi:hypothetical protein
LFPPNVHLHRRPVCCPKTEVAEGGSVKSSAFLVRWCLPPRTMKTPDRDSCRFPATSQSTPQFIDILVGATIWGSSLAPVADIDSGSFFSYPQNQILSSSLLPSALTQDIDFPPTNSTLLCPRLNRILCLHSTLTQRFCSGAAPLASLGPGKRTSYLVARPA